MFCGRERRFGDMGPKKTGTPDRKNFAGETVQRMFETDQKVGGLQRVSSTEASKGAWIEA